MLSSHYYPGKVEAGCDEAGRGCLAGSVYAAAVIFPEDYQNEALNDSKQLTDKRRHELREVIQRDAIAWAVGIVTPAEIDKINILNASILAMHRALDQLKTRPEAIIVDGNRFKPWTPPLTPPLGGEGNRDGVTPVDAPPSLQQFPSLQRGGVRGGVPYTTIVKGDAKYLSIAAASILAKTYRDDYMDALAEEYPQYDWKSNKGYPTKKHREAIKLYGTTPYHRLSYNLLGDTQLTFIFEE